MVQFSTKEEMILEYQKELRFTHFMDEPSAKILAKNSPVYTPHIYRGGWVIKGFGFSVERISQGYISNINAGNPCLVN